MIFIYSMPFCCLFCLLICQISKLISAQATPIFSLFVVRCVALIKFSLMFAFVVSLVDNRKTGWNSYLCSKWLQDVICLVLWSRADVFLTPERFFCPAVANQRSAPSLRVTTLWNRYKPESVICDFFQWEATSALQLSTCALLPISNANRDRRKDELPMLLS